MSGFCQRIQKRENLTCLHASQWTPGAAFPVAAKHALLGSGGGKRRGKERKEEEYSACAIQTHAWHEVERGSLGAELRERPRWGLFHLFVFSPHVL